jgi:hypothetical protein
MAVSKPGHLSKKNLKQFVAARVKAGERIAEPTETVKPNRVKKSLSNRSKAKAPARAARRIRMRIAAGKGKK